MPPRCFGDLQTVFPPGPDGLRYSPPRCLECDDRVDCLRSALATPEGAAVERGGVREGRGMGRLVRGLKRWSALKAARGKDDQGEGR